MSTSGALHEYERCVLEGYSQPLKKRSQSTKKGVLMLCEGTYSCKKNHYSRLKKTFYTRKKGKNLQKRGKPTRKTLFCAKISIKKNIPTKQTCRNIH